MGSTNQCISLVCEFDTVLLQHNVEETLENRKKVKTLKHTINSHQQYQQYRAFFCLTIPLQDILITIKCKHNIYKTIVPNNMHIVIITQYITIVT